VLGLNLAAPYRVIQTVLPNLERAATADDPARVINIASIAALDPGPFENYAYSASKTGLAMMTRHLGRHLAKRNITCNAIAPGLFPSRMTERFIGMGADDAPSRGWGAPLGDRVGRQDDIAGATIYLCSRAGAWLTGILLPVSGGVSTVT
jgi:NAD(P)-dependent dehydrogenase (short-subunit alcohol dehydrogenase family)